MNVPKRSRHARINQLCAPPFVDQLVVQPRTGNETGIHGGSIATAPEIGTKRFSIKIFLAERTLLSDAFTDSANGSTFARLAGRSTAIYELFQARPPAVFGRHPRLKIGHPTLLYRPD